MLRRLTGVMEEPPLDGAVAGWGCRTFWLCWFGFGQTAWLVRMQK